jgi:hypothetical protein
MDNTINPVSGVSQTYVAPAIKSASGATPVVTPQTDTNVTQHPVSSTTDTTGSSSDTSATQQYEAAARQAALSFKDTYALGDQNFSIFKDATGKYITRYVSLRDGKVTYSPEPTFVKPLQQGGSSRVTISV